MNLMIIILIFILLKVFGLLVGLDDIISLFKKIQLFKIKIKLCLIGLYFMEILIMDINMDMVLK